MYLPKKLKRQWYSTASYCDNQISPSISAILIIHRIFISFLCSVVTSTLNTALKPQVLKYFAQTNKVTNNYYGKFCKWSFVNCVLCATGLSLCARQVQSMSTYSSEVCTSRK